MIKYPEGFSLYKSSPFTAFLGNLYSKRDEAGISFGLLLEERHANFSMHAHGGVIAAMSDIALTNAIRDAREPPTPPVTLSLTTEYLAPASIGEWLIAEVTVRSAGRSIAFASAEFRSDGRLCAIAHGTFKYVRAAPERADDNERS
ncbi:PaaI family thioesterase [Sphingobium sp.]|uniref:PaaI family thioesterase n=1 Tax=Sphingobium sp. TaxID=1912891 RepID=UPI0028BDCE9E|nr:PaaI family thioesterase [Sphingobium sp.]